IHALDSLRRVAIGDRAHFQRVEFAELGDLVEGQRRVVHQPDGGRLRHEKRIGHGKISCVRPRPWRGRWSQPPMYGEWAVYNCISRRWQETQPKKAGQVPRTARRAQLALAPCTAPAYFPARSNGVPAKAG